jgi:ABC-type phosphate transport system substrate-binding protein
MAWIVLSVVAIGCGQGDTIVRVGRQNNSGTYDYFREVVLGKDARGVQREFKLGSMDQSGSNDVVELVSKTPNAIGYSGMGYATEHVKMLKVSLGGSSEAVAPTIDNAKNRSYPLARNLYVYVAGEPTGAVLHYLKWILSPEGQEIVEKTGYVPIDPVPMPDLPPPENTTIKVGGSDTMVNLAQAWAEAYGKKYPGVKIDVSGGGSGTGIAKLIDGTTDLANCSRDMKPAERDQVKEKQQKEVHEELAALDALAIYVHKQNPIDSISMKDLAEIYGEHGTIVRWSQLGSSSSGTK